MAEPTDVRQHLVIVSGLSGAGKSTALDALEDMGYHCVDNLPASLLSEFGGQLQAQPEVYARVALGIDARAPGLDFNDLPQWMGQLSEQGLTAQLLFLTADDATLVQRFGKTRRKHPLAEDGGGLAASIARERELLAPLEGTADWVIDTSRTNIHQLRHRTWTCVGPDSREMTVVLQSFGFKNGVPRDADFLFDARSLPNPYWESRLRPLTGRDPEVAEWLGQDDTVMGMAGDIEQFLATWLTQLHDSQRSFVTVAVGCTGGRHRSVFLVERLKQKLADRLGSNDTSLVLHHRDLEG